MRTIIDPTDAQLARLDRIVGREGISRAEAVRRAIDLAYPAGDPVEALRSRRQRSFGIWRGRGRGALAYVDALRGEWASAQPAASERARK